MTIEDSDEKQLAKGSVCNGRSLFFFCHKAVNIAVDGSL
jgi:hypothetical protein